MPAGDTYMVRLMATLGSMGNMDEPRRASARYISRHHLSQGNALGWFEELYALAGGDASIIPWADLVPNPNFVDWLDRHLVRGDGKRAVKVGCGLGDDAEELVRHGFITTAFDISQTAIAWCRRRFPNSKVEYEIVDLFEAPSVWHHSFDFVLESYTLQVLPPGLRKKAVSAISELVADGGTLLVISRGKEMEDPEGKMPWPLSRSELEDFKKCGLTEISFEDYMDHEEPPVRRFRVVYER